MKKPQQAKKLKTDFVGRKKLERNTVFVGIDVHKKKYVICVVNKEGELFSCSMEAKPEVLINTLKKRFKGKTIKSCYEAGFSGFKLHRLLLDADIENIVVNAASIEVAANNRVKTDKRDSKKMADQLCRGSLKGIEVPRIEEELARQFHRTREQLVRTRTRFSNQIKSKLYYFGVEGEYKEKALSRKYLLSLKELEFPNELKFILEILIDQWLSVDKSIKSLESKIRASNSNDEKSQIIASIPGVGTISANLVSTELGDISRFTSAKKLFSFSGLTPSEYSSGEHIRKGHITRQGSSRLRHVMVECAWRLIGKDPKMRELYETIKHRRGASYRCNC